MAHKPDFFEREARKAHIRELRRGHPNEDVNEIGLSDAIARFGTQIPFPDVCAHPECESRPIVGINKRFVCPDHMKWVLKPVRDALSVVRSVFA